MPRAQTPNPRTPEDAEDLALVAAIRRNEPDAWADLLSRYQKRLYNLCYRMLGHRELAADACQDAMVKIIEGLSSYDGRSKLSTWITRVTINVCLSRLRSEKYRRHASLDHLASPEVPGTPYQAPDRRPTEEQSGHASVEKRQEHERLTRALMAVSEEQRAILLLRDAHDLEYEQIAEVLGVAVGTVKSRLFRARAALRAEMERLSGGRPRDE